MTKYYVQIYRHTFATEDEDTWVDISSLELQPDIAQELVESGIVEIRQGQLPACQVVLVQKILRLQQNLGVNLTGGAIILDLLEQMDKLQNEIESLKRR